MDTRTYLRAILGDEQGERAADAMADAMGRELDGAVLYGTHATNAPIQENEMNAEQITEVSATVDAGLSQEDLDGMNEAERLALIVGSAYGAALADRDLARAALASALEHLEALVETWPETSWAGSNVAVERAREFIQVTKVVDSEQTPTQED